MGIEKKPILTEKLVSNARPLDRPGLVNLKIIPILTATPGKADTIQNLKLLYF